MTLRGLTGKLLREQNPLCLPYQDLDSSKEALDNETVLDSGLDLASRLDMKATMLVDLTNYLVYHLSKGYRDLPLTTNMDQSVTWIVFNDDLDSYLDLLLIPPATPKPRDLVSSVSGVPDPFSGSLGLSPESLHLPQPLAQASHAHSTTEHHIATSPEALQAGPSTERHIATSLEASHIQPSAEHHTTHHKSQAQHPGKLPKRNPVSSVERSSRCQLLQKAGKSAYSLQSSHWCPFTLVRSHILYKHWHGGQTLVSTTSG